MTCSSSRALAYDNEGHLTFDDITSFEECVASYSTLTMSKPDLSGDLFAYGGIEETINPALLMQKSVLSDIPTHNTPMQQP